MHVQCDSNRLIYKCLCTDEFITLGIGPHSSWIYVNSIVKEGCIPEDWKSSVILPIYKGKCDPMECGSYRGIKLLEHATKVVERIFEHRNVVRANTSSNDIKQHYISKKRSVYWHLRKWK